MKFIRLLLAGVAVVALLAGCGNAGEGTTAGEHSSAQSRPQGKPQSDLTELQLTMQSRANPEDAGLLLADQLQYFSDAGLNMWVLGPVTPSATLKYPAQGTDLVMSPLPQVILAQEDGFPDVAVGSVIPKATMSMIWLPESGIKTIADLKGKRIGTPGLSFQKDFLEVILAKAGLTLADVKLEEVAYSDDLVAKLRRGKIDAIFGGSWNVEGAALESHGLKPVVTKATDLGIPEFDELVYVARRGRFAKQPELLRDFLKASYRGAAAAKEDPVAATEAVVNRSLESVPTKEGEAGVRATAPLFSESPEIDRHQAARLIDWMYGKGMIKHRVPLSRLIEGEASGSAKP